MSNKDHKTIGLERTPYIPPQRQGQALTMLRCLDGSDGDEDARPWLGHWYSPDAVRELLANQRKRHIKAIEELAEKTDVYELASTALRWSVDEIIGIEDE